MKLQTPGQTPGAFWQRELQTLLIGRQFQIIRYSIDHGIIVTSPENQANGHVGFALCLLLALIFGLRLQPDIDTLRAINLIRGHIGVIAVHNRKIFAD